MVCDRKSCDRLYEVPKYVCTLPEWTPGLTFQPHLVAVLANTIGLLLLLSFLPWGMVGIRGSGAGQWFSIDGVSPSDHCPDAYEGQDLAT